MSGWRAVPSSSSSPSLLYYGDEIGMTEVEVPAGRRRPALRRQRPAWLTAPPGILAWRSGDRHVVAVNLSETPGALAGVGGRVAVATDPAMEGTLLGSLRLAARSGVLLDVPEA